MRSFILLGLILASFGSFAQVQSVMDDFEGNGTIATWFGDDCNYDVNLNNPYTGGINVSPKVMEYDDIGGQYANVRFQLNDNFDLSVNNTFSLKIYVPSSAITGSQNNQISLKLQDGTLGQPWTTQSEIVKNISLDQWQEVQFDFANDPYINLDPMSPAPITRTDFNRVLLQVNGENNNDLVTAYIDDFNYDGVIGSCTVYDSLVWSDEFSVNGEIDSTKWFHQTLLPNGTGWYNGELQHYTDRIENSYVDSGYLYIVAKDETFTDQGVTKDYTSARLNSKFAFTYGKVEVRAKLPFGPGTWPAIWMLGKNITEPGAYWQTQGFGTTGWPDCGEIDIMEHWGTNQNYVQSALHTPSSFGNTVNHGGLLANDVSNTFHIYSMEWSPTEIRFMLDGNEYYTYAPSPQNMSTWPFIDDQYILLNIAIVNTITTGFTESPMVIDYIRVFQEGNNVTTVDSQSSCGSYTWVDGVTYTTSTNTPTWQLTDANGCDSTVQLDLTINGANTGVDSVTSCGSYTWIDGITYTSSNSTATHTLTNVFGCDSIVTLNLLMANAVAGTDVVSTCGSYTWIDGNTYTASNSTATHLLTSSGGCDSLVTLNLTITNSVTETDVVSACEPYTWIDGNTYTASNNTATYTYVNGSVNGCDSIVELDLTIGALPNVSVTQTQTTLTANETGASYQWLDCGGIPQAINGETMQSFQPSTNGSYAVVVTTNGCSDTSECYLMDFIGIDTLPNPELVLHPNPTTGLVTIMGLSAINTKYSIFNNLGQLVKKGVVAGDSAKLDVSDLPNGVYRINIGENHRAIVKIP